MITDVERKIDLSIVIPLMNEEKALHLLLQQIENCASSWGKYEVIFVDDGSTDSTLSILKSAATANRNYKILSFSRNFGHQAALTSGLEHTSGDFVALMDGDLQDPPDLIVEMLKMQKEGFDIVYAVRKTRKENIVKRFLYKSYYRLFKYLADIDVPLDAGDFCIMSRRVVDVINTMPERGRFIRGLRVWTGFKKAPFPFDRGNRAAGETKFPIMRLVRFGFSGIMAFSTKPLTISIYAGLLIAFFSLVTGIVLILLKFMVGVNVSGWTSLVLVVFFMGSMQLIILGVLGKYIGLVYMEVQHRPIYLVEEKIGF